MAMLLLSLNTSDAADEEDSVDLGGRRNIKKKKKTNVSIEEAQELLQLINLDEEEGANDDQEAK